MHIFLLFFVISWILANPFIASPFSIIIQKIKKNKMTPQPITEQARIRSYKYTIAHGWSFTLVVLALCLFAGISFYDMGLRGFSLSQNIWFTAAVFIVSGFIFVVYVYCIIAYLASPNYRKEESERLAKNNNEPWQDTLTPRSKKEKIYWLFVSLTAGIGEEFIYRGVLFFLLQAVFPSIPLLLVWVIASVIFGVAHAYQEVKGIFTTALWGALEGALFLVTGSLILGMLLHFILDIDSAFQI
jgi:membrane protease YdiL (CAAX protease family)